LAAVAVGMIAIGRALARRPVLTAIVVAAGICASLLVLVEAVRYGSEQAQRPVEATNKAAAMIAGTSPPLPILSNTQRPLGFQYYLHFKKTIQVMSNPALTSYFCAKNGSFLYIDDTNHSTRADTSCLCA